MHSWPCTWAHVHEHVHTSAHMYAHMHHAFMGTPRHKHAHMYTCMHHAYHRLSSCTCGSAWPFRDPSLLQSCKHGGCATKKGKNQWAKGTQAKGPPSQTPSWVPVLALPMVPDHASVFPDYQMGTIDGSKHYIQRDFLLSSISRHTSPNLAVATWNALAPEI